MNKELTAEEWRDIPNYEGRYKVSNLGRVKSLERRVPNRNGTRVQRENILKLAVNTNGYLIVSLSKEGRGKSYLVSQLVAMAFIGFNPNGHQEVIDHINNDRQDNRVSNLQIITNRENVSKGYKYKKTSSKYTGVCYDKRYRKWISSIRIEGKTKNIGSFKTEIEAHNAYQKELQTLKNK